MIDEMIKKYAELLKECEQEFDRTHGGTQQSAAVLAKIELVAGLLDELEALRTKVVGPRPGREGVLKLG